MPLVNRFPNFDPYSHFNQVPRGFGVFSESWRETVVASAYQQPKGNYQRAMKKPPQGLVKIASVLLGQCYQPEDLSLEVDSEKIILHGQYQCEQENGFDKCEFTRVFKLPPGVDPSTVALHLNPDHSVVIIGSTLKHEEDKTNDGEVEATLDFRGFKPDGIKLQLHGNMLTATGIHHQSGRLYSRCILLPDDVDPGSVTSSMSKEGLLMIKASPRDQAKSSSKSSQDITITRDRNEQPKEKTTNADASGAAI